MKTKYVVKLKEGIEIVDIFEVINSFALTLGSVLKINLEKTLGRNPLEVILEEPSRFYKAAVDVLQGEHAFEMMASLLADKLSQIIDIKIDYKHFINALKNNDKEYLYKILVIRKK